MNLPKQSENGIRESEVVAMDLTVADFTLQFARQFALPYKKGVNIRISWRYEGLADVSVLILDLGRRHDFQFCIQENPSTKTWEVCCLYPVHLSFAPKISESDLPKGLKHQNHFRTERDKTGKYTFINSTDSQ